LRTSQIKRLIESIDRRRQRSNRRRPLREVEVWVDPDKMRAFNVTAADVATAIKLQNMELPGGRIESGQREFTVRTMGRVPDPAQFNNIAIGNRGVYAVKLSDIGYVEDGAEEQRTESPFDMVNRPSRWWSQNNQGRTRSRLPDAVKERLAELTPGLPRDVKTQIVRATRRSLSKLRCTR